MAKIAVDIDDTLYSFHEAAREVIATMIDESGPSRYDDPLQVRLRSTLYSTWDQWRTPNDICGTETWMEIIHRVHDSEMIRRQAPFAHAADVCRQIVGSGHNIMYISNRATESTEATFDWLDAHGFPLDDPIELVCMMDSKDPYLADCQYLVDDRPKTAIEFIHNFDWEDRLRDEIRRRRSQSDFSGREDPLLERALQSYYAEQRADVKAAFAELDQVADEWEIEYREANVRRAFVKSYGYNHNLTDVSRIYLAPTWLGLRHYLVRKGVIQ